MVVWLIVLMVGYFVDVTLTDACLELIVLMLMVNSDLMLEFK
jgi:hypothetical protein